MQTNQVTDSDWETIRKCGVEGKIYRGLVEFSVAALFNSEFRDLQKYASLALTGTEAMKVVRATEVDSKWVDGELIVVMEIQADVEPVVAEVEANRVV